MQFRFLYLSAEGEETKVASLDELLEKVRDGVVSEDTVLYDAQTREWGPARVHSAWREIVDGLGGEGDIDIGDPRAGTPPAMELTLAPDFLDDEGAVAAFVAARERERREEAERRGTDLPTPQIVRETNILSLGDDESGEPPPEAKVGTPAAEPAPVAADRESKASASSPDRRPTERTPDPAPGPRVAKPNHTRGSFDRRRRRLLIRGGAVLLVVAGLLGIRAWMRGGSGGDVGGTPSADGSSAATPAPVVDDQLASVLAEVEGSAFESMVSALDSLRADFGVVEPPEGWLGGRYLANASEFPEVPAYWERYRRYVETLRERDDDFFRQSYVARLATAGLTGPVASIRLASAMKDFEEGAPARDSVYSAMSGVARAALDLHILLLERERDITWTPVRPGFVTRDPVLEAVPDDEELRRQLNERLDVLLERIDVVRGGIPGASSGLGGAALQSLRNTRSPDRDEGPGER